MRYKTLKGQPKCFQARSYFTSVLLQKKSLYFSDNANYAQLQRRFESRQQAESFAAAQPQIASRRLKVTAFVAQRSLDPARNTYVNWKAKLCDFTIYQVDQQQAQ